MALRSKRRQAPGYKFPRARDNFYEDSCLERGILDDRLDCFLFYSLGVHESLIFWLWGWTFLSPTSTGAPCRQGTVPRTLRALIPIHPGSLFRQEFWPHPLEKLSDQPACPTLAACLWTLPHNYRSAAGSSMMPGCLLLPSEPVS